MITSRPLTVKEVDNILNNCNLDVVIGLAKDLQGLQKERKEIDLELSKINEVLKRFGLDGVSTQEARKILDGRKKEILLKEARVLEKEAKVLEKEARVLEKEANILEKEKNLKAKKEQLQVDRTQLNCEKIKIEKEILMKIDTKFLQIFGPKTVPFGEASCVVADKEKICFALLMDPFIETLKRHPEFSKINLTGFKEAFTDEDIQKLANYIIFDEKSTIKSVVILKPLHDRKITLCSSGNKKLEKFAQKTLTLKDLTEITKELGRPTIVQAPTAKLTPEKK